MFHKHLPTLTIIKYFKYLTLTFGLFTFIHCEYGLCSEQSNFKYYKEFHNIFEKINKLYVKTPDKQKLIDAALKGMVESLDPHSYYLTGEELDEFNNETDGQFGGVGIEVMYEKGVVKVVSAIDEQPAQKAGIKQGDFIVAVDDKSIINIGYSKAISKMRGEPGTKIKLKVINEAESNYREYNLIREIVKIKSVKHHIDENVAYIRISIFNKNTSEDLKKVVKELSNSKDLQGIILDLRNNPGGLLDESIKVVEYFIDSGTIVRIKERDGRNDQKFVARKFIAKAPNTPLVVIIDSGSASASEIVAGALQDHKRAIILGTKSFGKGSVQTFFPINNRSGLKITTAQYYTPNNRSIQAKGITPDIKVESGKITYYKTKKVFEKSLPNHLKDKKDTLGLNDDSENKGENTKEKEIVSDEYKNDYQYSRAIDVIKSINLIRENNEKYNTLTK